MVGVGKYLLHYCTFAWCKILAVCLRFLLSHFSCILRRPLVCYSIILGQRYFVCPWIILFDYNELNFKKTLVTLMIDVNTCFNLFIYLHSVSQLFILIAFLLFFFFEFSSHEFSSIVLITQNPYICLPRCMRISPVPLIQLEENGQAFAFSNSKNSSPLCLVKKQRKRESVHKYQACFLYFSTPNREH